MHKWYIGIAFFLFSLASACKSADWFLIKDYEKMSQYQPFGYTSGYIDKKGAICIALDKYARCYTDTFKNYALIYDVDRGLIGINKKEEKLFQAVWNGEGGPIEESDGMIIIEENGLYGYANNKGKIVIEPIYKCAESFKDGKAYVAINCKNYHAKKKHIKKEEGDWFYINKKGKRIK